MAEWLEKDHIGRIHPSLQVNSITFIHENDGWMT